MSKMTKSETATPAAGRNTDKVLALLRYQPALQLAVLSSSSPKEIITLKQSFEETNFPCNLS